MGYTQGPCSKQMSPTRLLKLFNDPLCFPLLLPHLAECRLDRRVIIFYGTIFGNHQT